MKITDIKPLIVHVNHRGDWVFVQVHTDEGLTGLGEASHSGNDALLLIILEQFKKRLVGEDPLKIEAIWHRLRHPDTGRVGHTALSAVEQALWDIMGQHLGVSIRTLFGGEVRTRLRLYANINRHVTDRSPEGLARAALQAVDEGFTAIKLAPFDELHSPDHVRTGPRAAWRPGVERVRAVRYAMGEDVELAVDCHGRMEASEAILVAEALADCNLLWYEEPVPHTFPDELMRVTKAVPMPTVSAESVFALEGFRPFLTQPVVDVIMPDVKHDGGLLETKRIAGAARMSSMLVAPHNPAGPVSTAATAQVMSTVTNFLILEYAWGEVDWRANLLEPAERIEEGYLVLPEGPGLGHGLKHEVLERHLRASASDADSSKVVPSSYRWAFRCGDQTNERMEFLMKSSDRLKIVVPGDDPVQIQNSPHLERLEPYGDVILYTDRPTTLEEKIRRAKDADILINSRGAVTWPAEALRQLPKLRMITTCSIGTDMIDLHVAQERGIVVCNQPGRTTPVVAEHLFGLMLALAKRAAFYTAEMKAGRWPRMDNILLRGKTLGIVGTGNIGSEMARLGRAIGMHVIAWTFHPSPERAKRLGVQYVDLDELLRSADVISLHVKLTDESRHLIGRRAFELMKPGALLVNGARGGLVDTDAFIEALHAGHLGGAAMDVYDEEPLPADHPLLACEQVVLTPHCADMTPEGVNLLNEGAVDNVLAFLRGQPQNVVV